MAKPHPNEAYRLMVSGIHIDTGDYWEMGFGYILSGEPLGTTFRIAGELTIAWADDVLPFLHPILANNVRVEMISAKCIGAVGGPLVTGLHAQLGTAGSACETIGNGAQIIWFGDSDPLLEGRTYIPGIPNDSFDVGLWDLPYSSAVIDFINKMKETLNVGVGMAADFVIHSEQIGIEHQMVADGLLRKIPGTQRRRLRR